MSHLTDDELYELAKADSECDLYTPLQLEQLEHLKVCAECFESYIAYEVIMDVTSAAGYRTIAEAYDLSESSFKSLSFFEKMRLSFRVVTEYLAEQIQCTITQLNQELSSIYFEPAPDLAARGGKSKEKSAIACVENIDNDRTYILFDPIEKTLHIHIDLVDMEEEELEVYVEFNDGRRIPMEIERQGRFITGQMKEIDESSFEVIIQ